MANLSASLEEIADYFDDKADDYPVEDYPDSR